MPVTETITGKVTKAQFLDHAVQINDTIRGDIVYVWNGTVYNLGPGQIDDGVSPRSYRGGPDGSVEAQAGHVARDGDWHLAVNP